MIEGGERSRRASALASGDAGPVPLCSAPRGRSPKTLALLFYWRATATRTYSALPPAGGASPAPSLPDPTGIKLIRNVRKAIGKYLAVITPYHYITYKLLPPLLRGFSKQPSGYSLSPMTAAAAPRKRRRPRGRPRKPPAERRKNWEHVNTPFNEAECREIDAACALENVSRVDLARAATLDYARRVVRQKALGNL